MIDSVKSLMELLLKSYPEHPSHIAIKTNKYSLSYLELDKKITCRQKDLQNKGVISGKIIPFLAREDLSTVIMLFALFRMGAIAFPVNRRLSNTQITSLKNYVANKVLCVPKNACLCLQTSGSIGNPKVALLSYMNLYYGALGSISTLEIETSSLYLLSLPLYHIAGIIILFRALLAKATIVLPSDNLLYQIQTEKITHLSFVPTQLYRFLKDCSYNPIPSVRHILLGGSSIPPYLYKKIRELQIPVLFSYGMTEMSSTIAIGRDIQNLHILPYRKVAISTNKEVLVQGKCLFLGYLDKDIVFLDNEGWFCTKDIGIFSSSNSLRICGRRDRMFISAGENIHPEMIEDTICKILDVEIVTVVTVPDREFVERPCAFIGTRRKWKESEYIEILRSHLSFLFLPIRLLPFPIMQLKSLKIDYKALQKIACSSLGITIDSF